MAETIVPEEIVQEEPVIKTEAVQENPVEVPDVSAQIEKEKLESKNPSEIKSPEFNKEEVPDFKTEPLSTTSSVKQFVKYPKEYVARQSAVWLQGYSEKTGIFDTETGVLKDASAKEVVEFIQDQENKEGKINSLTNFLKKEFGTIAQREEWGPLDWTFYNAYDQFKGINHMAYQVLQGDKWLPGPPAEEPETVGGQIAGFGGQAYLSYKTGGLINAPKWVGKAIPAFESFMKLPAVKGVVQMATGEGVTLPKEYRLSTVMADVFEMDEGIFAELAASEDEGIFEGRWKSFLDGFFTGVGGHLLVPPLMYFGKQLYRGGSFTADKIGNTRPFKAVANKLKEVKNNYIELFPETIVTKRDVNINKTIPKLKEELQAEIARKAGKTTPKVKTEPAPLLAPPLHQKVALEVDSANFRFEDPNVPPITKEKLPPEASITERQLTLKNISSEKVKKKFKANRKIPDGTIVEVRPTISPADALNTRQGKRVLVTVHPDPKTSKKPKSPVGYDHAVTLRNVEFRVNQDARYEIASGKSSKFPAMTAKGEIVQTKPVFEGIEVNFNPKSDHLFRIVENGLAIRSAEEAVVFDQRVLVRGKVTYWDKASAPKPKQGKKSGTKFKYQDRKKELITDTETVIAPKAKGRAEDLQLTPEEIEEFISGPIDTKKILGKINLQKIVADHDVIRAIEVLSERLPKHIPMSEEQAKRGAAMWIEELKLKGVDVENFLAQLGGKTKDLVYQVLAARILHTNQMTKFAEAAQEHASKALTTRLLKEEIRQAKLKGRSTEALEEKLAKEGTNLDDSLVVLMELAKGHQMQGFLSGTNTDIARVQRFQQIPIVSELGDSQVITDIVERELQNLEAMTGGQMNAQELVEDFSIRVAELVDDAQISNMVNKPVFTRLFEGINFININAMLSNLATNSVNITGTGIMTNLLASERILGSIFSKIPGLRGKTAGAGGFKESFHYIFGMSQALLETAWFTESKIFNRSATGQAWQTFKSGRLAKLEHELQKAGLSTGEETLKVPIIGEMGVPEPLGPKAVSDITRPLTQKLLGKGLEIGDKSVAGRILKTASIGIGLPGRGLLAGDAFFREINYRAMIHTLSWREATNLAGSGATTAEIKATYREIIRNLPEEIDEAAQIYSQMSLFHEDLSQKGVETLFHWLEKNRKATIAPGTKNFLIKNLGSNVATSFLLSKMPFVKTLYNIQKQMMWERGPVKAGRLAYSFVSDENAAKAWTKNPHQMQEDLAKITSGSMLMYLGYAGYNSFTVGDNKVQYNLNSPDINTRDLAQEENRMVPDITVNNIQDGTLHSIPTGRADPLTTPVTAGALIGLYEDLFLEIEALEESGDFIGADQKSDELMQQIFFQTGMFFTDKMALQGLKEILFNVPGLDHPYADPSKIINDYLVEWLNPVIYESLRKGIARAVQNQAFLPESKIKHRIVPKNKQEFKGSIRDRHGNILTKDKVEQLDYISKLVNLWIDRQRKLHIIDPDGDLNEEGKNDPIKRGCCWLMDLEGNLKGFSAKEESMARRFLENVFAPVSVRKVTQTNTSVLIRNLKIDWEHPKRWTKYVVPGTGQYIPLTARQQFTYGALAGFYNKHAFNNPRFDRIVKALTTDTDWKNIPELSSPADLRLLKEEVEQMLISNKILAGATFLESPEFKSLLDLATEMKILKHPEILKQSSAEKLLNDLTQKPQERQNL